MRYQHPWYPYNWYMLYSIQYTGNLGDLCIGFNIFGETGIMTVMHYRHRFVCCCDTHRYVCVWSGSIWTDLPLYCDECQNDYIWRWLGWWHRASKNNFCTCVHLGFWMEISVTIIARLETKDLTVKAPMTKKMRSCSITGGKQKAWNDR